MAESDGKSVIAQAATATKRKDPAPRHADGAAWGSQLRNRDPNLKYVFVNEAAIDGGVEFYEDLGYEKIVLREGGARPAAGRTGKIGEYVTFRGHVLMAIPKEQAASIALNGAPGAGRGQREWDSIQKGLLSKSRPDILQGVDGKHFMRVANETTEG